MPDGFLNNTYFNMRTKLFLLAFLALTIGAGAQNSETRRIAAAAIAYANQTHFALEGGPEKCVLKPALLSVAFNVQLIDIGEGILLPEHYMAAEVNELLVPSGNVELKLQYKIRSRRSAVTTVSFELEEGKSYALEGKMDKDNRAEFFVREATIPKYIKWAEQQMKLYDRESAIRMRPDYLKFSKEHPAHLEGVWNDERKVKLSAITQKYTFKGDRMTYEAKYELGGTLVAEGRLYYNEFSIIMVPERAWHKGKQIEDFDREPNFIWYYTLEGNTLNLIDSNREYSRSVVWKNTGKLTKITAGADL
jgi:hypothetical protein